MGGIFPEWVLSGWEFSRWEFSWVGIVQVGLILGGNFLWFQYFEYNLRGQISRPNSYCFQTNILKSEKHIVVPVAFCRRPSETNHSLIKLT